MAFKLIRSEALFKGRAFEIRRDWMQTPDGRETKFDIIDHGGSVILVPLDAQGNLLFVRQYRHAAGQDLLELPAGTLEKGEEPDLCAGRELREETGYAAGGLRRIGHFYLAPGYSTEFMVVYLATDLVASPLKPDSDEFITLERLNMEDALGLARQGKIPDAKSLAALFLAQKYLQPADR